MSALTEAWLYWEPMPKGKKYGYERCLTWTFTRFYWHLDWFHIRSKNCTSFWCTFVWFSSVLCKLTLLCGMVLSHEEKQWTSWHLMTFLIGKQQVHSTKWKKYMQYWLTTKLHRCVRNGAMHFTTLHLVSSKIYLKWFAMYKASSIHVYSAVYKLLTKKRHLQRPKESKHIGKNERKGLHVTFNPHIQ